MANRFCLLHYVIVNWHSGSLFRTEMEAQELMKFFRLDVYNSRYCANEKDCAWVAACNNYRHYLAGLQGVLPDRVMTLALLPGVHDGLVVVVKHDRCKHILSLTLRCGDLEMGYYDLILRYEEAEISSEDEQLLARIARSTKSNRRHESDLYYHELDLTDNGRIEHRFLFHPGVWFAIRCRSLVWDRIERPNRTLPRLKDRFPDGP